MKLDEIESECIQAQTEQYILDAADRLKEKYGLADDPRMIASGYPTGESLIFAVKFPVVFPCECNVVASLVLSRDDIEKQPDLDALDALQKAKVEAMTLTLDEVLATRICDAHGEKVGQ